MPRQILITTTLFALLWSLSFTRAASADTAREIDIPPGDLVTALESLEKQAPVELVFQPDQLRGLITKGVKGNYAPLDALRVLLRGTPLELRLDSSGAMVIAPARARETSPGATREGNGDGTPRRSTAGLLAQAAPPPGITDSSPDSDGSADTRSESVQQVIVTAQKRAERLHDVPISISVLEGADLDKDNAQGITEALNRVPGVVAIPVNQGGGTQIGIRGVSASGPLFNGSSPIAYYLDGVPFGLVKTAVAPDSDAFDLSRVEILRGPQGTLYGASALNGVVRVLTNEADLSNFELKGRGALSATADGGESYRGDVAVNVPIVEGKLAARAVVGYENVSGWIDSPVANDINDGELRNYRLKVAAQPTEQLSIGLSAWSARDSYGAPSAGSDGGRTSATIPQPLSTAYDAYNARIGYDFTSFVLSSNSSYLDYRNRGQLDLPGSAAPFTTGLDSTVISEELTLNSARDGAWRWSLGGFYRDAQDRITQSVLPFFGINWGDGSKSYAVFGEIGRRFLDNQFEWTLGLRNFHDRVYSRQNVPDIGDIDPNVLYQRDDSFSSTTPRAVLNWYVNHDVTLYASYSQGFRSGFPQYASVAKAHSDFPPVRPDKLTNFELGAKTDLFERRLSIDTAVYYMKWRDVQQTLNVETFGGVYITAPVNGQAASGPGIDFAATARPLDGLDLGVSVSWNDLSLDSPVYSGGLLLFKKGDRLNDSSALTTGASADYSFHIGARLVAKLSASLNYISDQKSHQLTGDGVGTLNSDSLLIGRAGLSVGADKWTAALFVDNFTNETGAVAPAVSPIPDWTPRMRPRTVGLQLSSRL